MKLILTDFSAFVLHVKITHNTASADAPEGMFLLREKTATASKRSNIFSMEKTSYLSSSQNCSLRKYGFQNLWVYYNFISKNKDYNE